MRPPGEGSQMKRRGLLQRAAVTMPFLSGMWSWLLGPARGWGAVGSHSRVRPGDPGWPSEASWNRLRRDVGGRLVKVQSPLAACTDAPSSADCAQVFKELKNPYYLGDEIGLTQSLGWVDAWTSRPKCVRGGRADDGGCRRRGQFRPRAQSASRREGRRPQLPRHIQCGRLTADLDAKDERCDRARRVHRRRLHRTPRAAAGGHGRGGCDLGPGLRCGHDEGGPLCPGRRLPDRWRCRPDPKWRLRKFLESVWDGCGEPVGGRDRHRRWRGEDRQRLHQSGPVLGSQGRRWREPRGRDPPHAADARLCRTSSAP